MPTAGAGGGEADSSTDEDVPLAVRARSGSLGSTPRGEDTGATASRASAAAAKPSSGHERASLLQQRASSLTTSSLSAPREGTKGREGAGATASRGSMGEGTVSVSALPQPGMKGGAGPGPPPGVSIPRKGSMSGRAGVLDQEKVADRSGGLKSRSAERCSDVREGASQGAGGASSAATPLVPLAEHESAPISSCVVQSRPGQGGELQMAGQADVVEVLEDDKGELSLTDPILKCRIVTPCKGDQCTHLDVFDKDTFVDFHRILSSREAAQGRDLLVSALRESIGKRIDVICQEKRLPERSCSVDFVSCDEEARYAGGPADKTFVQATFRVRGKVGTDVPMVLKRLASQVNLFGHVMQERLKDQLRYRAAGPLATRLDKLFKNLGAAYVFNSLKEEFIELVVGECVVRNNAYVGVLVIGVRVEPPKCPFCNQVVLKVEVCDRLKRELELKKTELRNADVVVVDKWYNILNVATQSLLTEPGADQDDGDYLSDENLGSGNMHGATAAAERQGPGEDPDGAQRGGARDAAEAPRIPRRRTSEQLVDGPQADVHGAPREERSSARAADTSPRFGSGAARMEGEIVTVNRKKGWFCFVKSQFKENLYCNLFEFEGRIASYLRSLPSDVDPENAVRARLQGRTIRFSVRSTPDNRNPGQTRKTGWNLEIPDLDDALQPAATGTSEFAAGGYPGRPDAHDVSRAVQVAGLPPKDPRVDPRTAAPPQDPRLSRQEPAAPVLQHVVPLPETCREEAAGDALVRAAEELQVDPDKDRVEMWLLLNGAYLCKMQIEPIQVGLKSAAPTSASNDSTEFQWPGGASIDMTSTLLLEVGAPCRCVPLRRILVGLHRGRWRAC